MNLAAVVGGIGGFLLGGPAGAAAGAAAAAMTLEQFENARTWPRAAAQPAAVRT